MPDITVDASQSMSLREVNPDTPDPVNDLITVENDVTDIWAYIDLDRVVPIGEGASTVTAELHLSKAAAAPSGATLVVHAIDEEWDSDTSTWSTKPDVRTTTVVNHSLSAGGADEDLEIVTITSLISESVLENDASGTRWFGVRLSLTGTTDPAYFHGAFSDPDLRPKLVINYSVPPDAPDDLVPSGDTVVASNKPIFLASFYDEDEDDTISAMKVEVSVDEDFTDPVFWESGEVSTAVPEIDSNAAGMGALTANTWYWWRAAVRDNHGVWSDWSDGVRFKYVAKPALVIDAPSAGALDSPVPTIEWTPITGQDQVEVEVEVWEDGAWQEHWLWPKAVVASSFDRVSVPEDYRLAVGQTYLITVRAWDTEDREDMPDNPSFAETSVEVTIGDPV